MRGFGLLILTAIALSGCSHPAKTSKNFAPYDCTSAACVMAVDTASTTDQSSGGN